MFTIPSENRCFVRSDSAPETVEYHFKYCTVSIVELNFQRNIGVTFYGRLQPCMISFQGRYHYSRVNPFLLQFIFRLSKDFITKPGHMSCIYSPSTMIETPLKRKTLQTVSMDGPSIKSLTDENGAALGRIEYGKIWEEMCTEFHVGILIQYFPLIFCERIFHCSDIPRFSTVVNHCDSHCRDTYKHVKNTAFQIEIKSVEVKEDVIPARTISAAQQNYII